MAYTYKDFENAARAAGLYEGFSPEDLATAQRSPEYGLSLLKLQQDSAAAKTAEQRMLADEAINQLRTSYGQLPAAPTSGNGGKTAYQQALEDATTQGSFRYDPETDPAYVAARKSYLREGQRSMEDTLARASGGTGGVPSTAAVTAAQQANDYYNAQFADMVPTLQQNAYQRYLDEVTMDQQRLNTLREEEDRRVQEALRQYQLMGYATKEVAEILGIPYDPNAGKRGTGVYSGMPPILTDEELQENDQNMRDEVNALQNLQSPRGSTRTTTTPRQRRQFSAVAVQ